jgi:glycerol-3-phosphate O-acyltransferase
MNEIAVPFWLFSIMLVVTAWAVLSRLLIPSTRWVLRRRVNRVIDQLNSKLNISIRPFQLTKRQVLIDRLVFDPKVMHEIEVYAHEHALPRAVVQTEAMKYAREIVPSFNAYVYFRFGYWLARRCARLLYRVRAGFTNETRLGKVDTNAAVVFVMNHRSNMDYVLVAFLAAEESALSYAVGEWARVWPLQQMIRAMGAYFVRRKSDNTLYRRVLERYVHMATEQGVCQAVFPEGGLSKDGHLREPKLGILDYMLRGYDCEHERDIVFVPVGINYDRVIEDRTLVRAVGGQAPRRSKWFVLSTTAKFISRQAWLMLRSRWVRFGYAAVNFGKPLSMRDYCQQQKLNFARLDTKQRFVEVERLAKQLMVDIHGLIPVLPIPLLCQLLMELGEKPIVELELRARFYQRAEDLATRGRRVIVPNLTREHTFSTAIHMLRLRHLILDSEAGIRANLDSRDVMAYYANSINDAVAQPLKIKTVATTVDTVS